ncbi:hypothetical protein PIGHUM_02217 [Pigmentiphaga humi]|uniref:Lipoprotein n=1 Tax=Pigmentiphaga humi TaxID=2478468 RepID=A0A3P4B382_9BURK|nr:hypothetical protein [Pigmentiphaga humi]VCU70150.1 hypothetical protein PIGHUM_02217 [Pigmentiphaga humi]
MSKTSSAVAVLMTAGTLAACGGGSGGDSGGGGGGSTSLTNKQMQWYGHETAFTGMGVSQAIEGIIVPAIMLAKPDAASVECDEGGSATGIWTDADDSGALSAGDTVALTATECTFSEDGIPFSGKATVVFDAVSGEVYDDSADWALKATATLGAGAMFDDTLASGSLKMDIAHASNGTAADESDDVNTVKVETPELKLTNSYGGKTYPVTITNYASAFAYRAATDTEEFSALQFTAKGADPVLGAAFSYDAKLAKSPLSYSWPKSGFVSGTLETKISTETITTTFSSTSGNPGTVTFSSSLGGGTSLTYAQFDDLEP